MLLARRCTLPSVHAHTRTHHVLMQARAVASSRAPGAAFAAAAASFHTRARTCAAASPSSSTLVRSSGPALHSPLASRTSLRPPSLVLVMMLRRHKSCGLVGMPNVGKSTLFNALTRTQLAQAANYPFCTVEPNVAHVAVPDPRLERLATIIPSDKVVPAQMTFVDIAGLIRGAHAGAGLGAKFLSNIREASVILHVLRCFHDSEIVHVSSKVDPIEDMAVVEEELLLADLQTVDKRIENAQKRMKTQKTPELTARMAVLEKCSKALNAGVAILDVVWSKEELPIVAEMQLLTHKPMAYLCNVDEASAKDGNELSRRVLAYVQELSGRGTETVAGLAVKRQPRRALHISAQLEADAVAGFDTEDARREFLQLSSLTETSLDQVIRMCGELLRTHVYYTIGKQEARSWSIPHGCMAAQAAGVIHSDFEKGFIGAEVIKPTEFAQHGGHDGARAAGKATLQGRNYVVEDGDVMLFRFHSQK